MRPVITRSIAVLAVAAVLASCQEAEVVERPDPVVRAAAVELRPLAETRTYTGTVVPRIEVAEAFRVGGKITARLVDIGDRVEKGQVLARLDPVDLGLQLQQGEAELRAARAGLATAEADAERARALFKRGHVAQAALDSRLLAVDEAHSRLDRAEQTVNLAANQMKYAELKASAAGAVSATSAESGQVVSAGQPVVTVARLDEKEVEVAIPESRLADLEGSVAEVTLWAGDATYRARLREIAPGADPTSRTYPVRFSILDADAAARLGMTASVSLTKGARTPVARVPMTALLDDGRGPVVFVVDPTSNELERRPVVVLAYRSEDAVISEGLSEGERIVTLGIQKLAAGTKVRVVETQSASAE